MTPLQRSCVICLLTIGAIVPVTIAFPTGAPPRVTGAPGDAPQACAECHVGGGPNTFNGNVKIVLPGANTYSGGVKQHIQVVITDPVQQRWGFEFTARLNSDLVNGQAGTITSTDGNTQVICDDGSAAPCANNVVQFITHTEVGTRNGTMGPTTFEFDWTPPAAGSGAVTLYVAANAANGNGLDTGDHIYTSNVQLSEAASAAVPTIGAGGIVNGASFQPAIAPGSWAAIFGSNLSSNTRGWQTSDFNGNNLPAMLDDVSVTIDGIPAYVSFISPGQLNVLVPDDSNTGSVPVVVTNSAGVSQAMSATLGPLSPGFFLFDGKHVAATHLNGNDIGASGAFPNSSPASPGETIVIYGTGFGPTTPGMPAGQLVSSVAPTTETVQVTVNGQPAQVLFSGLIPGFAGLYQLNVQLPSSLPNGDVAIVATVNNQSSPSTASCCFLSVDPPAAKQPPSY